MLGCSSGGDVSGKQVQLVVYALPLTVLHLVLALPHFHLCYTCQVIVL